MRRRQSPQWARYSDAELLRLRFRDLHLGLPRRAALQRAIRRLRDELAARDILLEPHFWFADEWFSPDGIPGIAIPFYLAHPRLERLERRMSRSVEGGNANGLLQILRHEAGHAVDTAFRLRRRKLWRQQFGSPTEKYPAQYAVDPSSRAYVSHLDGWYAQAHPAEDFAETFAVWLSPRSAWRRRYAGTPALTKLEAIDSLMREIRGRRPAIRSADRIEPVATNELTLREHYRRGLLRRMSCDFSMIDAALRTGFAPLRRHSRRPTRYLRADTCLRQTRDRLVRHAMAQTAIEEYGARQLLQLAIERCRERRLWMRGAARLRQRNAEAMIRRLARAGLRGERVRFTL
ncbi:MAG: putative zinc-binding metallopeptidase [Gammaproteobacteria bacterium]